MAEETSDPLVRINADIPRTIHQQFKMACITRGETMTDVISRSIENYIHETKEVKKL